MAYYEVKRKLRDSLNGYEFLRGEFVETNEGAWASRFGGDLAEIRRLPDGAKASPVAGTLEQKAAEKAELEKVKKPAEKKVVKESKEEEKPQEEKPRAETRARMRPTLDKVVRSGDSDIK